MSLTIAVLLHDLNSLTQRSLEGAFLQGFAQTSGAFRGQRLTEGAFNGGGV